MNRQLRLVRGSVAALLLSLSAGAASAQPLLAASHPSTIPGHGDFSRAASLGNSHEMQSDSTASNSHSPFLPPPPQMSRKKAITLGIVLGGAVGATAGYFITHDSCDSCDDNGPVVLAASLGAVAGAALGGFVAAQNSPAGPSQSSLRTTSAQFLALPHPVVRYQIATFR
jgi:hypothetical protein